MSTNSQILKINNNTFLKTSSGTLTKKGGAIAIGKLASNFKKLDDGFFAILIDRAQKNGFNDEMLIKAVDTVIDNYVYNEPKVADILKINSNVQLFTYYDIVNKNDSMNKKAFQYYRPIIVPGIEKPMYASVEDIQKYNLQLAEIK